MSAALLRRVRNPDVLQDMLDYRLYLVFRDCGQVTEKICRREFGVSRRRVRIIFTLMGAEGIAVGELARRAELDIAQTSRTVGTMMRERLLRRLSNPDNARFSQVVLTDRGRQLYHDIVGRYREINHRLLEVLSDSEVVQLDSIVDKLRSHAATVDAEISAHLPPLARPARPVPSIPR
jgi:DNA-binding MarR family transcriptional regulator